MGFVPCNMVSEVQVEDTELAEQLLKECQTGFNPNMPLSRKSDHAGDVVLKKRNCDVGGLFSPQVNWDVLVSKLGKINEFWHWKRYRLLVHVI